MALFSKPDVTQKNIGLVLCFSGQQFPDYILLEAALNSLSREINKIKSMVEEKNVFIHHVFFWLAEPENAENRKLLIEGLKKLSTAPTIQRFHIGEPAGTSREVIDASYSVSWCLFFASTLDQDRYQVDPIHLRFVDECKHLWKRVQVYDTVNV
jgi:Stress responsive A/B Barrel Domain